MTNSLLESQGERWIKTGFARRFLFSQFALKDPEILIDAITKWEKLPLSLNFISPPASRNIPFTVTEVERHKLKELVRYQYGRTEPLHLLLKIYAVLKWHYGNQKKKGRAMEVIEDFAESLGKEGARLEIPGF